MAGYYQTPLARAENNRKPTTLARESGFFLFFAFCLVSKGECPVDPKFLRKCVDSIMKLDQKSKVKVVPFLLVRSLPVFLLIPAHPVPVSCRESF